MRNELELREQRVRREEEKLEEEFRRLEENKQDLEEEKEHFNCLAAALKRKGEEMEDEVERSVAAYEEGVAALKEAKKIEEEQKARLYQIENQIEKNQTIQKELAEERLQLARERVGKRRGGHASSIALSAGEIIENDPDDDRTVASALDSLLVDDTVFRILRPNTEPTDHSKPSHDFQIRQSLTVPKVTLSNVQRPISEPAFNISMMPKNLNLNNDRSLTQANMSELGDMSDPASMDAVMELIIHGQKENEYLREQQKFLARLSVSNLKK